MLDPKEHRKRHADLPGAWRTVTPDVAAAEPRPVVPAPTPRVPRASRPSLTLHRADAPTPSDGAGPLETLYERFDRFANGCSGESGEAALGAILQRVAANRRFAEAAGWTAFAYDRDDASGRLRLVGRASPDVARGLVPDRVRRPVRRLR